MYVNERCNLLRRKLQVILVLYWCKTSGDLLVAGSRGRCWSFWLVLLRQRALRLRASNSDQTQVQEADDGNAVLTTNDDVNWWSRRLGLCPVGRLTIQTSDGTWRIAQTHDAECAATKCFVCYRRKLSPPAFCLLTLMQLEQGSFAKLTVKIP